MEPVGLSGGNLRKVEIAGRWFGRRPDGSWVVWNDARQDWEPAPAPPDALLPPDLRGSSDVEAQELTSAWPRGRGFVPENGREWRAMAMPVQYLIAMMLGAPVMTFFMTRIQEGERPWWVWLVITVTVEIVLAGTFFAQRAQLAERSGPPAELGEPILAAPSGMTFSPRRAAIVFLIIFALVFASNVSFGLTPEILLIDVGIAAVLTLMWEFRGTYGGLALAGATGGWLIAAALEVLYFVLSMMTWSFEDGGGPNFALWWAASGAFIFLLLLPFKQKIAEFQMRRPQQILWGAVMASMLAAMILAGTATRFTSEAGADTAAPPLPAVTTPAPTGLVFPPPASAEQAAGMFVRAWARGDWTELERVSSPPITSQAEAMGPQRGTYLGCDDVNGQPHCILEGEKGFILVLASEGNPASFVTSLQTLDRAAFDRLVAQGFSP